MKNFQRTVLLLLAMIGLGITGCAQTPAPVLPTYPQMSDAQALHIIAKRTAAINTVSGQAAVTLSKPAKRNGDDVQSVSLDGVLAIRTPDHFRMRAYKLGQPVFDLTIKPEGVWLWMSQQASDERGALTPKYGARRSWGGAWPILAGGFVNDNLTTVRDSGGPTFELRRPLDDHGQWLLVATVDRATLTIREYDIVDFAGHVKQRIMLSAYREVGITGQQQSIPWPMKVTIAGPTGRIGVDIEELNLNVPLPATAFEPPQRATRQ